MKYYHATAYENIFNIMKRGICKGVDKVVYLAPTAVDAAKFPAVRGITDIVVFEVSVPDKDVVESFDHSENFFKCRAYYVPYDIEVSKILNAVEFKL